MPTLPKIPRPAALRATRLVTLLGSAALATSALIVLPVVSFAENPQPVTPSVQEFNLGSPEQPGQGVDVGQAGDSPAPAPTSESPSTSDGVPPSGSTPTDQGPAPTPSPGQPSATPEATDPVPPADQTGQGTGGKPTPKDETDPQAPMVVPPGSQTLVLDEAETKDFASVGVSWMGDAPVNGIALQIRVRSAETGQWSDWSELSVNRNVAPNPNAPKQRQGSDPYWFGTSTGIEIVVTVTPETKVTDLKLTLIDPKQVAQDANPNAAPSSSAGAALSMPSVYSRAAWGADESKATWKPEYMPTIKAATLHHTADGNNYSQSDVPAIMRSIYHYQAVTLGWGDIGYNVVVDKFGSAWEGRKGGLDQPVVGAHAGGFNQYTFGVSMLGNYDVTGVPDATREKVAQLIAWKFKLYGVNPKGSTQLTQVGGAGTTARWSPGTTVTLPTIFGHRDSGYTACPGQYGYAQLPWIRERAAQIMATLDPPPPHDPEGAIAASVDGAGNVAIDGWLVDRSAIAAPVNGAVTVDGNAIGYFMANGPRPELAYYGIPGDHGFKLSTKVSAGTHQVCLFGSNVGGGRDSMPACKSVIYEPKPVKPIGALAASGGSNGTISVDGWAYDGTAPMDPVTVAITTDGKNPIFMSANGPRPELAYYGMKGNHGFAHTYRVGTDGAHQICMYMIDIGSGQLVQAECETVSVSGNDPVGAMAVKKSNGAIAIDGWAFDPSDPYASATVMITRNGEAVAFQAANQPRPELANFGVPGNHGFALSVSAASGTNSICLFVFNIGPGADKLVQCSNA